MIAAELTHNTNKKLELLSQVALGRDSRDRGALNLQNLFIKSLFSVDTVGMAVDSREILECRDTVATECWQQL